MPPSPKPPRLRVERGLYKQGDTWYASACAPGERRPRFKSLGKGFGIMQARALRDQAVSEIRSGTATPTRRDRATVADVATEWLELQKALRDAGELRKTTYAGYESAARLHVVPVLGHLPVDRVTPEALVRWHSGQRATGAAPWSIKARWTVVRLILGHAARHGLVAANPADLLTARERPKRGETRKRFLDETEMANLIGTAAPRWRTLVAVGLFGGLRIAEALGLTWEDVDFDAGLIHVRYQLARDGKRVELKTGDGRRDVVLMPALAQILRRSKMATLYSQPADPVFSTASRRHVSARNATRAMDLLTTKAKLDDVTFHALRHTFASILVAQGRDPVFVADQLGHADASFTLSTYAKLFRAAKQATAARDQLEADFGHLLRGASGGASNS